MMNHLIDFFSLHQAIPFICAISFGTLFVYYIAVQKEFVRRVFLFVSGIAILGILDYSSLIFLVIVSVFAFLLCKKITHKKKLFIFLFFILLCFILSLKSAIQLLNKKDFSVLFGSSYYLFRILSFVVESYKGNHAYKNVKIFEYFLWVFFPPIIIAGPIMRFHELQLVDKQPIPSKMLSAYILFFIFVFIKLVFVDIYLYKIAYVYCLTAAKEVKTILSLILFGASSFLHAYIDLLLYTELSKALARFFGFSTIENFNYPLLSTNISQFWQRWHMSLSGWTRDYIFFPVLIKTRKTWLASYSSMLVIGMWHQISLNWFLWALLHGSALNVYSLIRRTKVYRFINSSQAGFIFLSFLGSLFVLSFVSFVFILVAFNNFKDPYILLRDCFLHYARGQA